MIPMLERPLVDIPGIYTWDILRLNEAGIRSCGRLLLRSAEIKHRKALGLKTNIEIGSLLFYANACDLMRITGVGPIHINLLRSADCKTVLELSCRNPDSLHRKMWWANTKIKLFPPVTWVKRWVNDAKNLPKVITYR